jgi:GPI mannosyltransferase 1 subunit M
MSERLVKLLTKYAFTIGLAIRLLIAWLLPLLLDDGKLIPGVAYTDVDYHVFSDAANYVREGKSPYQRHTYRYTPFLALILSKVDGRYLFCLADALCGKIILRLQKQQPSLLSCFMWMYNPLVINISTRGSAESFVVLLPVLLTVAVTQSSLTYKAIMAGVLHGIAVHAKVYPVIYTLSFMVYFGKHSAGAKPILSLSGLIATTFSRLLRPAPLCFFISFLATFVGLTYVGIVLYGTEALDEGLLYHLTRVDHRHNYSMWWYPIYLARRQTPGMVLLVPQAILLIVTSLGLTDDLGFTLFLQTYMFVTLNKVITAQYFTWYLCLLPLCNITMSRRLLIATVGVVGSMLLWLACAYLLEMQGWPVHRLVWMASVIYFAANIHLLRVIIQSPSALRENKTKQS